MKKRILFLNPFPAFVDILEAEGYEVVPVHDTEDPVDKKIWSGQPKFIIYLIGNMDFNGIDPLERIPRQYWDRTIVISQAIDKETLLNELDQRGRPSTGTPLIF